jgi:hypothetical protein
MILIKLKEINEREKRDLVYRAFWKIETIKKDALLGIKKKRKL